MIKFKIQNSKFKIYKTIFLSLIFFAWFVFFSSLPVEASTIYLDPAIQTIGPEDTIEVKVKIGVATGECINAAQIGISFPSDILEVKDFNSGESLFSLWVARPEKDSIAAANKDGKIVFSGGTPGGYCGKIPGDPGDSNILGSIVFSPKKPIIFHKAKLDFTSETQAFINDGQGTIAPLSTQGAVLNIDEKIKEKKDEWAVKIANDKVPPAPFVIMIDNSLRIADGKYFVVFSTTDKETGIDHYEVLEARSSLLSEKKLNVFEEFLRKIFKTKQVVAPAWKKADSPYILKDQALNSVIRVRAIDRAGNERTVELDNAAVEILKAAKNINPRFMIIGATVLFLIIFVIVPVIFILRKRRKEKI